MEGRAATAFALLLVWATFSLPEKTLGQQIPACAANLAKCATYLNSTKPPEECCGPLKDSVKNDLPCMCSLLKNKDLITTFNINLTQVLELPKHCGITGGTSLCNNVATTTNSNPFMEGNRYEHASPGAPTAAGNRTGSENKVNGACGLAWIGTSGLTSIMLFLWSVIG